MISQDFFGHGFGSTLKMPFQGGHPHNLFSLFWIELGCLGGIFLTLILGYIFYRLHQKSEGERFEPALYGLFVSGFTLFIFSFSIWQTEVVLMHLMFWIIVNLIISKKQLH